MAGGSRVELLGLTGKNKLLLLVLVLVIWLIFWPHSGVEGPSIGGSCEERMLYELDRSHYDVKNNVPIK